MKRTVAILLALCMVIAVFTGCTASTDTSTASEAAPATEEAAPEAAEPGMVYELKLAHHLSMDHVYTAEINWFAQQVEEQTGGAVKITVYPNEQLGDEETVCDAVIDGTIDMGLVGPGVTGAYYAPITILECCYIFRDIDHMTKVVEGEIGQELSEGLVDAIGVRTLCIPYYGTRHVTTGTKAINSAADIQGLKLRCPNENMITSCLNAMGFAATPMAFSEVYLALSQGAVDGQENPITTILSNKFYEVQDYICLTGHTIQTLPLIINEEAYQAIPAEYQAIMGELALEAAKRINEGIIAGEAEGIDELKADGMTVTEIDTTELRAAITQTVVPQFESAWGEGLYERIQDVN
jgi:tripartite ATP-independent transporter DctP family solute receptor